MIIAPFQSRKWKRNRPKFAKTTHANVATVGVITGKLGATMGRKPADTAKAAANMPGTAAAITTAADIMPTGTCG